ncbi:MAG: hypothetical protein H8E31_00890, partial [Planctomycetes bacterium]|nr:hypothetical protein [Planctomycetota bacterium]
MLIPSLLTTLLAIQSPHEPQDPFRQGSAGLRCHAQPLQQALRGHEPDRLRQCRAGP